MFKLSRGLSYAVATALRDRYPEEAQCVKECRCVTDETLMLLFSIDPRLYSRLLKLVMTNRAALQSVS